MIEKAVRQSTVLGIRITPDQLCTLGLTAVLVAVMHLLLTRSHIGRAMRAVSENPALARVVGIDVSAVIRTTWLIGGALACAAGVMLGLTVQIRPYMGFDLLLPLFAAAILGGIGSVPGAVVGGLIVGLAESAGVQFIGANYRAAIAFLLSEDAGFITAGPGTNFEHDIFFVVGVLRQKQYLKLTLKVDNLRLEPDIFF